MSGSQSLLISLILLSATACDSVRRPSGGNMPAKRDSGALADGSDPTDGGLGRDALGDLDGALTDAGAAPDGGAPDQGGAGDSGLAGDDAMPAADAFGLDAPSGFDAMPGLDALEPDAGAPDSGPPDAGFADSGQPDSGAPDAGFLDAGSGMASAAIAAARALPNGPASVLIDGPLVTWVRSVALGTDLPGFAVQADQAGPALWVEVDPATLSPTPVAGDRVRFTVTQVGTDNTTIRKAQVITGYTRLSSANPLGPLVQDVSGANNVVTNLADYELELVRTSVTVASSFRGAGTGYASARAETPAVFGEPNLELRVPQTVYEQLGLGINCTATVQNPLWRFAAKAQLQAYGQAELAGLSCPAARVVSASAPRPDRVLITFDRPIQPSSVTTAGFQLSGGLTVLQAQATTSVVILTTSAQIAAFSYSVDILGSVRDARGNAIDPSFNFATFSGAAPSAILRINEVNANITGGCDLVELRVVQAGLVDNWVLRSRDATIVTLSGLNLNRNDYIVVHANGTVAACNPGSAGNETSPAGYPASGFAANFDSAFDWYGGAGGIVATNTVLSLLDPQGNIADAVLLSADATGMTAAASEDAAAGVAAVGEWSTPSGTVPPGGFVDDSFCAYAVPGLGRTGVDRLGNTIQRTNNADTNNQSGWAESLLPTWGANNAGQSNF